MPGLCGAVVAHVGLGVGERALDLLRDRFRVLAQQDRSLRRVLRLRHLLRRRLEVHDARADFGERRLRHHERLAVVVVEADRDVACQLHVLTLVVADGHLLGVVEEDVGDHQHRVVEQPDAHELLALGLLLELGHAPQLAERGRAVEHPGELGVRPHVALDEQQAAVRGEARGHQPEREPAGRLGELLRLVRRRHRVQVDDAEDRVVVLGGRGTGKGLVVDPAADRAEVVAELHLTGGFDPREHPGHAGQASCERSARPPPIPKTTCL